VSPNLPSASPVAVPGAGAATPHNARSEQPASRRTSYRWVTIEGLRIFYREAGPPDAPTVLLLHGFPSSSRMFEPLLSRLADRYHLVAPDYPGFGHSDAPAPDRFVYTFDHLAQVIEAFTRAQGLTQYALYLQDYGGPVGFRLALAHPERVTALVIQNAVAHEVGLQPGVWAPRRAWWADRQAHEDAIRRAILSVEATRLRHVGTSPHPEWYDPDLWTDELAFLNRPGMDRIQLDLMHDYRTNLAAYPVWQSWLRERRPPILVVWGRYDTSFAVDGANAYREDVPDAEVHLVDAGHFALDEAPDQVAQYIRDFLDRRREAPSD
jgi:pimeloyl-ACP methyl ester carboxylesterase